MIEVSFTPWADFQARKKSETISRWLKAVGDASVEAFRGGMKSGSKTRRSRPGEFPAVQVGALRATVRAEVQGDKSVTVGTSTRYAPFLRHGTSKMARREMSDDALRIGIRKTRLEKWVEWSRT